MNILVINAGSSSLKYQLIDMQNESVLAKGLVERIAINGGFIRYEYVSGGETHKFTQEMDFPDHQVAFQRVAELLTDPKIGVIANTDDIKVIGHRVVHGGEKFKSTQRVTPEMMKQLQELIPLAPLHNPANIIGIEAAEKIFTKAENFAIFDTSFHYSLPPKAYRYAIPNKFYTDYGIRVYGFHGTSHKYVDERTRKYFQKPDMKNITIHLGNGASMAAVNQQGLCVDTSLGFGPNEGLMMGTRSGSIDSAIIFFLKDKGFCTKDIYHMVNKDSGMKGIAGSSDARDVQALYEADDPNGKLCMEMYTYRIQKFIGAYMAALNGCDALIFTAGIGENSALVRSLVCNGLDFLGVKIDETKNKELSHPKDIVEIQAPDSKVKIVIVATNEELQIAREILPLLKK